MGDLIIGIVIFAGGYVASVYSWPKLREWMKGAEAEALSLRDKASTLEAKARDFLGH